MASGLLKQLCCKVQSFARIATISPSMKQVYIPSMFNSHNRFYSNAPTPHEVIDTNKDELVTEDVIKKVNQQAVVKEQGRLFAVVHLAGKQFKITEGDAIIIEGYWPPTVGDKISLDKVLMLGASDFTLIGRPLIQTGLVDIHATVIEKTLSHTKTNFKKKRRKQYKRINFYRIQQTMLRINKVEIIGKLNDFPDVTSVDRVIP